jgi:hypothetical protein
LLKGKVPDKMKIRAFFHTSCLAAVASTAFAGQVIIDGSNSLKTGSIPSSAMADHLLAVIASPDTPSKSALPQPEKDSFLSLEADNCLACRGPTLSLKSSDPECASVALCSLTAAVVILDGITEGDVEAGLKNSRHAVTLTAVFRAKATLDVAPSKQAIILYVDGPISPSVEKEIKAEVLSLFSAAAAENKNFPSFDKVYDLQIVSAQAQTGKEVRFMAHSQNQDSY